MMKFKGTMPALITPLLADESIHVGALRKMIQHFLDLRVDGFYVGGATGEGICLSRDTREVLAEESVKAVNHKVPCIIHVASTDFNESIALAKQAEKCGADAISAIPPIFYKYDEDAVFRYYQKLADAVNIPLMVYYNPNAGFRITADIAAHFFEIDNVTSIKWTNSDFYEMLRLKDITHGEMGIINGCDEMLLMGLSAGADGGIGTTYNYLYPLIDSIYQSFMKGEIDQARNYQRIVNRVIAAMHRYSLLPCCKALMEKSGFDVGDAIYPMERYTDAEKDTIYADAIRAGMPA